MSRLIALLLLLLWAPGLQAACDGRDLLPGLPPETRAGIEARAAAAPYPSGNLWRAARDGAVIHVVGTFHIGDARMRPLMTGLAPLVEAAALVLVEVTPAEEAALEAAILADPGLAFITAPPTLRDLLGPEEWDIYAREMRARGVPSLMAARFRPWLAFTTLGIPACLMAEGTTPPPGLDDRIITHATGAGVPVAALEGPEVLSALFDALSPEDALDVLRATLMQAELSEDLFATLADAYFAGNHRLIWEFGRSWLPASAAELFPPERLGPLHDRLEETLLIRRNRAWAEIILARAADTDGPLLVAVGAAHLSGPAGLLELLADAGFALTRLD